MMETCLDCGAELPLKVLKSSSAYYIGYFCPNCGPYGRISEYFQTAALAEAVLITMSASPTKDDPIRCRQCGSKNTSLYMEDCYHDVTCKECGCRTGKYGDENECMNLWSGEGVKFYAVMWQGGYSGMLLEIWDDEEIAEKRSKKFNKEIADGKSIHGYKLDLSLGIREYTSVKTIEPNIPYVRPII
jgi:DNA-directed RNA polymerase subunit RPC12/RpoP